MHLQKGLTRLAAGLCKAVKPREGAIHPWSERSGAHKQVVSKPFELFDDGRKRAAPAGLQAVASTHCSETVRVFTYLDFAVVGVLFGLWYLLWVAIYLGNFSHWVFPQVELVV
jgi:hypothetical protein